MRTIRASIVALALLAPVTSILVLESATAIAKPSGTTVDRTIGDFNGDNSLEYGPGEPYAVQTELAQAKIGRTRTQTPIFRPIIQLTDFQLADEESPARVEQHDDLIAGVYGAYRPQEALVHRTVEAAVRQVNGVISPITGRDPSLTVVTGDSADNMQKNETDNYIRLLSGGNTVDPDSGDPKFSPRTLCRPPYPSEIYQGPRGENIWYEPDGPGDGPGYSPSEDENFAAVGRHVALRDFKGILEEANSPFSPTGLDTTWLAVFGNHDNLVQGNVPATERLEGVAQSCFKVFAGPIHEVQPDPERHLASYREWISAHLADGDGHGFDASYPDQGYYSVSKPDGLRLIGLDSVNEEGLSNGNIDGVQFEWLDRELDAADRAGEVVVVFAHHGLVTMNNVFRSEGSVHCGLDSQGKGCELTESLESLFYRHPSVIGYVAGHEHENRITPREKAGGRGFWEIVLASENDWPQQSGMLEIFDNHDGTYSIFRTVIDHLGAPDPGDSPDLSDPLAIASIGREIAFNDPQGQTGEDGTFDAKGGLEDRNVELVVER